MSLQQSYTINLPQYPYLFYLYLPLVVLLGWEIFIFVQHDRPISYLLKIILQFQRDLPITQDYQGHLHFCPTCLYVMGGVYLYTHP